MRLGEVGGGGGRRGEEGGGGGRRGRFGRLRLWVMRERRIQGEREREASPHKPKRPSAQSGPAIHGNAPSHTPTSGMTQTARQRPHDPHQPPGTHRRGRGNQVGGLAGRSGGLPQWGLWSQCGGRGGGTWTRADTEQCPHATPQPPPPPRPRRPPKPPPPPLDG
jgi:hypothetical protein